MEGAKSLATSVMIHEIARHNLGIGGELLSTPLASDSRLEYFFRFATQSKSIALSLYDWFKHPLVKFNAPV